MNHLFIFILSCAGITQILCYASILNRFRPKTGFFGELLKCSLCTGFHVGYLVFFLFWYSEIMLFPNIYVGCLLFAAISSLTSYILDKSFNDEGISINLKNKAKMENIYTMRGKYEFGKPKR